MFAIRESEIIRAFIPVHKDVSGRQIFKWFLIGLFAVGLSDISNGMGGAFLAANILLGVALASTFVLSPQNSLTILLVLAIAGKDIVGTNDFGVDVSYSTASLWQFHLGPIRPSWIMFLCVGIQLARLGRLRMTPTTGIAAVWFLTVPFFTSMVYGGMWSEFASTEVVVDLKFGFMLIASLVLFLTVLRSDEEALFTIVPVFVGLLLARHFYDLIYYFFNIGPALVEGVSRVSEDTAKGGVIFLIYFGIAMALILKRLKSGLMIGMFSVLLLAVYGTRLLWVTFVLGALALPIFVGLRRSLSLFSVLFALVVGGMWLFYVVSPRTAEVILARSTSITAGREIEKFSVQVPYNVVSRIDPIRYGEGMNIFHSAEKRFSYLWGVGYGGFYEDEAVTFPPNLQSSYPDYSLNSGIFYSAHLYSLQMFLKHGVIGLFVISSLWWIPGFMLLRTLVSAPEATSRHPIAYAIMLCLIAFLPTAISQLYWSGKGLFLNGAIIAICMEFARRWTPEGLITMVRQREEQVAAETK